MRKRKSEMAYCFQQRRRHLAWYVRDGDARLIAEGMLETTPVKYVYATKIGPIVNKEETEAAAMRTRSGKMAWGWE
jgi:hypothetical protein